jgi:hypothetical protein
MPNPLEKSRSVHKDTELIRAINSGRQDLIFELVKCYQKSLYHFGLKMCDNPSDAEDMVQDTFLNVFKYLEGFTTQETAEILGLTPTYIKACKPGHVCLDTLKKTVALCKRLERRQVSEAFSLILRSTIFDLLKKQSG